MIVGLSLEDKTNNLNSKKGETMSDHHNHHHEDESVNVRVALFFVAVLAAIFFLGVIN